MKSRGYSLIETILASFLLVFTFFLVSSLFNTGLQYSSKVDTRMTSVRYAQKRMSEIRNWAKTSDDWSGYPVALDDEFPGYELAVAIGEAPLLSPSRELEASSPSSQRVLRQTAKQFTVTVKGPRSPAFVLAGIVTKAERQGAVIVTITGTPSGPVGPGPPVLLTASAVDSAGKPLTDVFFHWSVEPVGNQPSSASIKLRSRDGREANFENKVLRRNGTAVAQDGACKAVAYVRYNGRIWSGETPPIELAK